MTNSRIARLGVLTTAFAALPAFSFAGEPAKEMKTVVEKAKESCITGDLGINVVSQYISRGVIFENQGGIFEPYADLYFKLYEGEGFLNKITLNLGIWNSFHSRKTDAGLVNGSGTSSTRSWYEFDFTPGFSFTFAKNFTFSPSYYMFLSPNDGFSTLHALNLALTYDTTDLFGFNLAPKVQVLFELENKAGTGADEGVYYEVGIAPSFPIGETGLTVTFPITAGFGSSDFYGSLDTSTGLIEDESFGFVTGGVSLSYALSFVPECLGKWTASAGYAYYYLGDGTSDFNTAERGGLVRDHREHEHIFSGGLVVAF
jgi:hypothetical protein